MTVKIRFGDTGNGGPGVNETVTYGKKSPSRQKRDADRLQDRRKTRSMSKMQNDQSNEVELPRSSDGSHGDQVNNPIQAGILSPAVVVPDSPDQNSIDLSPVPPAIDQSM